MNGNKFSTKDQDNDNWSGNSCTDHYKTYGGWWYGYCYRENMNGYYYDSYTVNQEGMVWKGWKGNWETMKKTWLMIRPRSFTIQQ